ncbi:MAG TPA: copper resistance protein CopC [Candidatus Limnocylindria bacterium]|jgi:copper transport protein|nr:copper resistance protein CopC [Candidatus Limnocylindria bacterium]
MRRLAFITACALGSAAFLGGAAEAHANYVRSNPASDARLVRPPTEVRIEFSEPPDPRTSMIQVLDTAGKRYDKGEAAPSGDPNGLKVSLATLAEGGYVVAWTTTSAVDGHTTRGSFAFVVGTGPIPAPPDVGDAAPPPTAAEIAGRALSYAGIALALGTAVFVLFVRAPAVAEETRREYWLLLAAGALVFVGSVTLIIEQGPKLPPRLGAMLAVRAFAGIVIAALSAAPPLARMRPVAALAGGAGVMTLGPLAVDRPRRVIALAAGLAAALTATLVSHATALANLKSMVLDYVHVVAVSVWTGGVVALLAIVLLRASESTPEERRALGATVWRFSVTALVAVCVLVTAGTLQAFDRLVLLEDLYETPYGIALAAKIALLAAALGLGALNLLRLGPRLRAGLAARAGLVRDTIGETALFVVIIVAASFLTAFAPPAQPSAAAFDQTHHVSGLRLEMLVASAQPGRNRYVLRVHQGLAPVQGAEKVAFRFTMAEHDMGEQELVASERAPGEYAADGSPTAMFGTWRIQAIVRLTGREDVSTVFSFPVGAGTGSQSQVVTAAPYTMIVFTDPAEPQAGAPLTVFAVVIGPDGNPVTGKSLRATFTGPTAQAPIDATEDAPTLGPGRYKFSLAALDAGSWKVAIAIGSEASGTSSLEVSR